MAATTQPARKRAPRKIAPKPATPATPAQAAVAEVLGGDGAIEFEFRGEKFAVTQETLGSARFQLAYVSQNVVQLAWEMLGDGDDLRLFALLGKGEAAETVLMEFLSAFGNAAEASGQGNS